MARFARQAAPRPHERESVSAAGHARDDGRSVARLHFDLDPQRRVDLSQVRGLRMRDKTLLHPGAGRCGDRCMRGALQSMQ